RRRPSVQRFHPPPPERLIGDKRRNDVRFTSTQRGGGRPCPTVMHHRRDLRQKPVMWHFVDQVDRLRHTGRLKPAPALRQNPTLAGAVQRLDHHLCLGLRITTHHTAEAHVYRRFTVFQKLH